MFPDTYFSVLFDFPPVIPRIKHVIAVDVCEFRYTSASRKPESLAVDESLAGGFRHGVGTCRSG